MSILGKNKPTTIWQVITGENAQTEFETELYVKLKNEIFQVNFDNEGRLSQTSDIPKTLIETYITKEIKDKKKAAKLYGFTGAKGSKFIQNLKAFFGKKQEPDESLTYEHLFADRIHNPTESNIVLVGDTGCGKTHKLHYIWTNYLSKCQDCDNEKCPSRPYRPRLWLNIDSRQLETKIELFKTLYDKLVGELDGILGTSYINRCEDFVSYLFSIERPDRPDYFSTIIRYGLQRTSEPISFDDLAKKCPDHALIDLLKFILHFYGWLRENHCKDNHLCIFIVFDNMDSSPQEVQKAIMVSLLNIHHNRYPLMVGACRHETLINWIHKTGPFDEINHIGPSAYEVVIERLKIFIEDDAKNLDQITNLLQHLQTADVFINNLQVIYNQLLRPHFKDFFDDFFDRQIRGAIVFAQSIVDIAAHWSEQYVKEQILRSDYSLERYMLNPWGLQSDQPLIANIYGFGSTYKDRLLGIRALLYIYPRKEYTVSIKDVCNYLSLFGYENDKTLKALSKMLQYGLILTVSKDNYKLGKFEDCQNEVIHHTSTGEGFRNRAYSMNYISTVMYSTMCQSEYYPRRYIRDFDDPKLLETLDILRVFIRETWEIERSELEPILTNPEKREQYIEEYDNCTISYVMYTNIIPIIIKIGLFESKRGYSTYRSVLDKAVYFISDFIIMMNAMTEEFKLEVDITSDTEYMDEIKNMRKVSEEEKSELNVNLANIESSISPQNHELCKKWIQIHIDLHLIHRRLEKEDLSILSNIKPKLEAWNKDTDNSFAFDLARIASLLGESDEALNWLSKALDNNSITIDNVFDSIEFETLLDEEQWEILISKYTSDN